MKQGNAFSGFRLDSLRDVASIQSEARIFTHEKTGARLLKLLNKDDNRVFSICFRTPPYDDTGLPHILEHSVLTGSRKFPTKEPFVELLKSSLNTFLNAMTYPDKTMYPVASRNEKDFFNLMDVYLDAVFFPNIYDNPYTLMQEGWHHEISSREGPLGYSGVVYNEMKGAFSSPERILYSRLQTALFPDNCYAFESGGDPEAIPTLGRDKFLDFHRTYYHPSNGYVYLYGNGDTEKELAFIGRYLDEFEQRKVDSGIGIQAPFPAMKEYSFEFPLSTGEDTAGRSFLALAFASGLSTEADTYLAFEIVRHILLGTPASPLKRALLKAGIGKDVMGIAENGILQPFLGIIIKDTDIEKKEVFLQTVRGTLADLVKNGLDAALVEASLNYNEFQLREAEFPRLPKGLYYHMRSMDSWLYCDDPLLHLDFAPTMARLRAESSRGGFERFIETRLLNNTHAALLMLTPKPGLAEEREARLAGELAAFRNGLADSDIGRLVETNIELKRRQSGPDSPEDLAKLPTLALEDINPGAEIIPSEEAREGDITVLYNDVPTNGISYLNLYFDTSCIETPLLPYAGLLAGLLGKISTRSRPYSELARLISHHTGGLSFFTESFSRIETDGLFHPRMVLRGKALDERLPNLMELAGEIAAETEFSDRERLREVVKELKSRYEMSIADQGHMAAQRRLFSYLTPMDYHDDLVSGFSFYKFLAALERSFDESFEELRQRLEEVREAIFTGRGLLAGLTAGGEGRRQFRENLPSIAERLPAEVRPPISRSFEPRVLNEGLMLSQSQVQYVAKGFNFMREGHRFRGAMHVLASVLRLDYLWNRVRVQGGAYGAMMTIRRNGNLAFSSYRDPHLSATLDVYRNAPEYLRTFNAGLREMMNYIIGTVSNLDQLLTPQQKGDRAALLYLSGISPELLQTERDEVLSTEARDVSAFAELLGEMMREECHCVLGSEIKIREEKGLFGKLVSVIE